MSMGIEILIIEKIAKQNIHRTRGYLVSTRSLVKEEITYSTRMVLFKITVRPILVLICSICRTCPSFLFLKKK